MSTPEDRRAEHDVGERLLATAFGTTHHPGAPALGLIKRVIRMLAKSGDFWLDDCWIVDSTPIPCGMSGPP